MIRLAVVSHALAQEASQVRWQLLAERYPVEVTLIIPKVWKSTWLRQPVEFRPVQRTHDNFAVVTLPTTSTYDWTRYLLISPDSHLRTIRPDVLFVVHEELICIHQQLLTYRSLWAPKAKYLFFSMNALPFPQHRSFLRFMWRRLAQSADGALVHYPGCEIALRKAGFQKPVFLQTQLGIDPMLFCPSPDDRELVRRRLLIDDKFVVGYVGRLVEEKGIRTILTALSERDANWHLLLVGDGPLREWIIDESISQGLRNRVTVTGAVPLAEVPSYMRAMDCFVIGSITTPTWIDTFPNVVPQAMASGVPVIGSSSGAIPWIVGDAGIVYPEGDAQALRQVLLQLASDPARRANLSIVGIKRARDVFGVSSLTDGFYQILTEILK